jgi:hypothetical protein
VSGTFATSAGVYPPVAFGQERQFRDVQTAAAALGGAAAVFCQGSNVASAGQFVMISNNSAVLLDSGNSTCFWPIGIAGAPMTATNVYGWVGVQGVFDNGAFTNVVMAANNRIALASTAGQIGSVTALGSGIRGIAIPVSYTSTDGSIAAVGYRALTVELARPFLIGVTASN